MSRLDRLVYRSRQFWLALSTRPGTVPTDRLSPYLSPAQLTLFRRLQPSEQAHAFLVLERLPQAEQQKAAASLKSGAVFITQLPGPELRSSKPEIPDGLVHHWLGVVRVPGVRVDDVLAFVQRYDESPRFFSDAIAS